MSVTRIAEAVQPTTWVRTADSACGHLQYRTPVLSRSMKTGLETLLIMLNPIALSAFVLAAWRLGQDLDWTGNFFIAQGLFSHWQIWLVIGIALKAMESILARLRSAQPAQVAARRLADEGPISRAA